MPQVPAELLLSLRMHSLTSLSGLARLLMLASGGRFSGTIPENGMCWQVCWAQWSSCCLGCLYPTPEDLGSNPCSDSYLRFLTRYILGGSRRWFKNLDIWHPYGRPRWSSGFLALAWFNPSYCKHLNQWMEKNLFIK